MNENEQTVYKLKFERYVVDNKGLLKPIEDKPTLENRLTLSKLEYNTIEGIFGNPDIDVFEKLVKEIRLKI